MGDPFVITSCRKSCFHLIPCSLSKPPFANSLPVSSLKFPFSPSVSSARRFHVVSNSQDSSQSADLDLIATHEHHDGSVIFRFGNASEVVEKSEKDERTEASDDTDGEEIGKKSDHTIKKTSKTQSKRRRRKSKLVETSDSAEDCNTMNAVLEAESDKEAVEEMEMSSSAGSTLGLVDALESDKASIEKDGDKYSGSAVASEIANDVNVENRIALEEVKEESEGAKDIALVEGLDDKTEGANIVISEEILKEESEGTNDVASEEVLKEKIEGADNITSKENLKEKIEGANDIAAEEVVEEKIDGANSITLEENLKEKIHGADDIASEEIVEEKIEGASNIASEEFLKEKIDGTDDIASEEVLKEKSEGANEITLEVVSKEKSDGANEITSEDVLKEKSLVADKITSEVVLEEKSDGANDIISEEVLEENIGGKKVATHLLSSVVNSEIEVPSIREGTKEETKMEGQHVTAAEGVDSNDKTGGEVIDSSASKDGFREVAEAEPLQVSKTAENGIIDSNKPGVTDEDVSEENALELLPLSLLKEAEPTLDEETTYDDLDDSLETDDTASLKLVEGGALSLKSDKDLIEYDKQSNNISVESTLQDEELLSTGAIPNREQALVGGFALSSGAASLRHPSEVLAGREDAYFVYHNWLAVADGVGQWSLEGTKTGPYAQELMENCKKIVLEHKSSAVNKPEDILLRGVAKTDSSGSSTAVVACFDGQALHVANIGDCGFMIIRDGVVYAKSTPMLHEFNFPVHFGKDDDPSKLAERYKIGLEEGDVIVTATDGLFDNLYEQEIALTVTKSLQAGMKAQEIAGLLASSAQEVGRSSSARSPVADAAQAAGYVGYTGGKLDHVTVIVSLVRNTSGINSL